MRKPNLKLKLLFFSLGMLLCIAPPLIATLSFFPFWLGGGSAKLISGFTLFLCLLAHVPLLRAIRRLLRSSSSYLMWLIIFLAFLLLESIAYEMTVISFFGFIGGASGAVLFKLSERFGGGK